MAIHAAVQFSETLEQTAKPSGLPRACGPRNDELGRNRKNKGKYARDQRGKTGKPGKEKETGRGRKSWRRREKESGVIQTPENLLRYLWITEKIFIFTCCLLPAACCLLPAAASIMSAYSGLSSLFALFFASRPHILRARNTVDVPVDASENSRVENMMNRLSDLSGKETGKI
ncbi:MAG: hypothetical protein LBO79_07305 [Zoogloeaceae bacterium]|nr:hypothetical protein [Zoogloeaceae bacterium]